MSDGTYRLLTRSDFDGLVCAMLLRELDLIDDIKFVHPKDVQDGVVEITDRDILTNLPYVEGCHLCFDHHHSEKLRTGGTATNHVLDATADSAARVVYDYYGGAERFNDVGEEIMEAVDKADAARFTRDEVLRPEGWELLSFLMDARTGLGRFREFRVSNYQLMMQLIEHCRTMSIDEVLELPDVAERVRLFREHEPRIREQIERCSTVHGDLVVLDLRTEDVIYAGNRFLIYAMHPECSISMHVIWGLKRQNTVFAVGKSIFNRTCPANVGELMLEYGGGGHSAAGTCQIANDDADRVKAELIARIGAAGLEQAA
ncbi:MAG: exopolyphosphatase [Planctomycetota bacterium]|jgi:nanoRNase/pAp phosphatase (c-di-AMP/oligoRNAs hydrolase)